MGIINSSHSLTVRALTRHLNYSCVAVTNLRTTVALNFEISARTVFSKRYNSYPGRHTNIILLVQT